MCELGGHLAAAVPIVIVFPFAVEASSPFLTAIQTLVAAVLAAESARAILS